ncbi:serine palmitoyltransferase component [Cryptotrichosporon argae]
MSQAEIPPPLIPLLSHLSAAFVSLSSAFHRIPGSPIVVRYIQSSYQNDPWRSLLEVLLVAFALRTLLKGRTRGEGEKGFVKLSEKEVDELVDEWTPAPLVAPLNDLDALTLPSVPTILGANGARVKLASAPSKTVLNLAVPDWTGMIENDKLKEAGIATMREYGVGSCGPMGFYGFFDVHAKFEKDLANFLGTESSIIYSQAFATVSSVIPAFAKRGDIIVADRGVNFAIHKGIQISRSTVRWYAHGDMKDLERVLGSVDRELKRKGGKLTRRFIVTEGVFENDGMLVDLPKIIELKKKFKYRLMLDESQSFGMLGAHGRGATEFFGVDPVEIEMLVGSMAQALGAAGGFVAGSDFVAQHQRINSAASVFSAALPPLHSAVSSAAVAVLAAQPNLLTALQANILVFRQQLARLEPDADGLIQIPSHPASALIHIFLVHPPGSLEAEERLLQDVVDEALKEGVLITRARRLRGQETFETEPSLKIHISASFTRKEMEKAGAAVRHALVKVCGK